MSRTGGSSEESKTPQHITIGRQAALVSLVALMAFGVTAAIMGCRSQPESKASATPSAGTAALIKQAEQNGMAAQYAQQGRDMAEAMKHHQQKK